MIAVRYARLWLQQLSTSSEHLMLRLRYVASLALHQRIRATVASCNSSTPASSNAAAAEVSCAPAVSADKICQPWFGRSASDI